MTSTYWGIFYLLIYTVLMDVFISTVIEHYEKRLKQSDEKMEHALIEAAVHRDDTPPGELTLGALSGGVSVVDMGLPEVGVASDLDEILVLS